MALLLAESDDALRLMLGRRLTREGYAVDAVADGPAALLRIAESTPALLVVDLGLEGADALIVCQQARTRRSGARIVVTSPFHGDEVAAAASRAGADEYLPKPFATTALLRALANPGR